MKLCAAPPAVSELDLSAQLAAGDGTGGRRGLGEESRIHLEFQ